jgi:hypothetical protein
MCAHTENAWTKKTNKRKNGTKEFQMVLLLSQQGSF